MRKANIDLPVAFIIFNRPDTTAEVFEEIKKAAPSKLYIISDAPREGRPDDIRKVAETRKYVEENIDWDCEVHKDYAESNMGCKMRVSSGITRVLEQEEYTVILEDDVVPMPEFFPYCKEMLEYYKDNRRVMMVSGTNLLKNHQMDSDYTFSCFSSIWGWATWARAWKYYDVGVKDWPKVERSGIMKAVQPGFSYIFLKKNVNSVYSGKKDTWDIQWDYCRHKRRGLGIVPRANMIRNIGFDREDATHTTGSSKEDFSYGEVRLPMDKDVPVKRDVEYDKAYILKYFGARKVADYLHKKLFERK